MNQFANVLTRIAGEPLKQVFTRRIAREIGMSSEEWDWGDFGEAGGIVVNGGSGNNNKHVLISSRQLARLGHLFLNGGAWNGKRLISAGWVGSATRTQVAADVPMGHRESGIAGPGTYGFNWWTNGVKPDGKRKWPGVPDSSYSASGHNNNDMFVIPAWGVVVVRLGLDQSGKGGFEIADEVYAEFLQKLGAAIVQK
jgi:CubicO group peptidase (beta-lactamase class C family)